MLPFPCLHICAKVSCVCVCVCVAWPTHSTSQHVLFTTLQHPLKVAPPSHSSRQSSSYTEIPEPQQCNFPDLSWSHPRIQIAFICCKCMPSLSLPLAPLQRYPGLLQVWDAEGTSVGCLQQPCACDNVTPPSQIRSQPSTGGKVGSRRAGRLIFHLNEAMMS